MKNSAYLEPLIRRGKLFLLSSEILTLSCCEIFGREIIQYSCSMRYAGKYVQRRVFMEFKDVKLDYHEMFCRSACSRFIIESARLFIIAITR